MRNKGFSDAELKSLKEYVDNEQDSIYAMAKGVNPIHGESNMVKFTAPADRIVPGLESNVTDRVTD